MGFKIIVSKKAQLEIEKATAYYSEINTKLAFKFYLALIETYNKIELNSYFQIKNNIFSYETIIYSMSWIDTSNVARSFNSSTFVH